MKLIFYITSVILIALIVYYIDMSAKERRRLQHEVNRLSEPQHCKSVIKDRTTGLVTVMDSTGKFVCQFYDSANLVKF